MKPKTFGSIESGSITYLIILFHIISKNLTKPHKAIDKEFIQRILISVIKPIANATVVIMG